MDKFIEKMKETLEMEDQAINPTDVYRQYDIWDSLAALSVMAMINEEYDLTIPREDFINLKTINELWSYIQARK